jgi:hypothetical protein
MASTHVLNPEAWTLESTAAPARRGGARRSAAAATTDDPRLDAFLSTKVVVESVHVAKASAARRGASQPPLALEVTGGANEGRVVAVRHASGAITFHPPTEVTAGRASARRSATAPAGAVKFRFEIPPSVGAPEGARRGLVARVLKVVVLKIAGKVADAILPAAVAAWERRSWKKKRLVEGWVAIDEASLRSGTLKPVDRPRPNTNGRALLLLHGTFSHAANAFRGLASHDFFDRVVPTYGASIFAFNHFSLARTPEDNARALVDSLPAGVTTFDVITHSRGGLVLRNLVERSAELGKNAARFKLGNGLIVACPSKGTPLATPEAIAATTSWIANLVEMFPDNPLTTAIDFVSEALTWIGSRVVSIPGLASMDAKGQHMRELNAARPAPDVAYSALVTDYEPEQKWLARLGDLAVDGFFGSENDLVVPTRGGWQLGPAETENEVIPETRVGIFGEAGNLSSSIGPVHHLNIFDSAEASAFAANAVLGEPLELDKRRRSAAISSLGRTSRAGRDTQADTPPPERPRSRMKITSPTFSDVLFLAVIEPAASDRTDGTDEYTGQSQIVASYSGARVVAPFRTSGGDRGALFQNITRVHQQIRAYIAQESDAAMPTDDELREFGSHLFEALFPPQVKRLYDVARSRERATALNVIFTSMTAWVADLPWEYAYDSDRRTYLATEDVHFVRNVMTAVPAERIEPKDGKLRVLVVGAQPTGETPLSIAEEDAVIRRGFAPLAQLVEVDTLPDATPAALHSQITEKDYDVVHFIGHGLFDETQNCSLLRFENAAGRRHDIDARSVRELLCGRGVRLVFLNACESARGGLVEGVDSVAQALVKGGMVAVVANQFSVLDVSATEFAQNFYWRLAQGMTIGKAMREARIAINYSTDGENLDWAIPVLFARDPETRMCVHAEGSDAVPFIATQVPRRASRDTRRTTEARDVGVWEMVGRFPDLANALAELNRVQDRFRFRCVSVSVPATAMKKVKGELHLEVRVAARRLCNAARQLDLDHLLCIVDTPLWYEKADGKPGTGYGWWPMDPASKNPLVFFSAGFKDLPTSGPQADKAVANAVALGLIGSLTGTRLSKLVPKKSILYANDDRSIDWITGKLTIDPKTRAMIAMRKAPHGTQRLSAEDLAALTKLLAAFS